MRPIKNSCTTLTFLYIWPFAFTVAHSPVIINSSKIDGSIPVYQAGIILSPKGYIAGEAFCRKLQISISNRRIKLIIYLFVECGRPTHRATYPSDSEPGQRIWSIQNDIPWTATFVRNKDIFCTGVLINTLYILTAGNCVHK
jgi:hypothetical protein